MVLMTISISLIAIFLTSSTLVWCYLRMAPVLGLVDEWNHRSSHTKPTPRGGGCVFAVLWIVVVLVQWHMNLLSNAEVTALIPGALACAAAGFGDDLFHLSARIRLAMHVVAAVIVVGSLGAKPFEVLANTGHWLVWVGFVLEVATIVWSINLFNFMDGLDGLAGSEAMIGLGVGGLLLWNHSATGLAVSAWMLCAALGGFLVWNGPRAKVFMGDVGSGFLGFVLIVYAILGQLLYGVPAVLWLMLCGIFWFDATVTLLRRLLRGEKLYEAHRLHAYQRLHHVAKWTHGKVLLHSMVLNGIIVALAGYAAANQAAVPICIGLELLLLAGAYFGIERIAPLAGRRDFKVLQSGQ